MTARSDERGVRSIYGVLSCSLRDFKIVFGGLKILACRDSLVVKQSGTIIVFLGKLQLRLGFFDRRRGLVD